MCIRDRAYASVGSKVIERACGHATGAYFVREGQLPFISPVGLSVAEP